MLRFLGIVSLTLAVNLAKAQSDGSAPALQQLTPLIAKAGGQSCVLQAVPDQVWTFDLQNISACTLSIFERDHSELVLGMTPDNHGGHLFYHSYLDQEILWQLNLADMSAEVKLSTGRVKCGVRPTRTKNDPQTDSVRILTVYASGQRLIPQKVTRVVSVNNFDGTQRKEEDVHGAEATVDRMEIRFPNSGAYLGENDVRTAANALSRAIKMCGGTGQPLSIADPRAEPEESGGDLFLLEAILTQWNLIRHNRYVLEGDDQKVTDFWKQAQEHWRRALEEASDPTQIARLKRKLDGKSGLFCDVNDNGICSPTDSGQFCLNNDDHMCVPRF
jgi:hypothetical protein